MTEWHCNICGGSPIPVSFPKCPKCGNARGFQPTREPIDWEKIMHFVYDPSLPPGPGNRGEKYGPFAENAKVSQALKNIFRGNSTRLRSLHLEALDQIALKISRILTGDPNYIDNWEDIAGYATIVAKELKQNAAGPVEEGAEPNPVSGRGKRPRGRAVRKHGKGGHSRPTRRVVSRSGKRRLDQRRTK